jgi:hypothetical protein
MKFYLPMLFALLLMSASATATETLDELTTAVRKACENHDGEALWALYHVKGQPEELTAAFKPFLAGTLKNKDLLVVEIKSIDVSKDSSGVSQPGKFKDKDLEFLVKPTHAVQIRMATPEGANPSLKWNANAAAARVEGKWKLIGIKFKE